jgi:enoyl-CoA hydratase
MSRDKDAAVLIRVKGKTGRISLNRPEAIHALNHGMCVDMIAALQNWAKKKSVGAVIIDHSEGRGFCAGGDIRMLAESGAADGVAARRFFHDEYQLNHLLFIYEKPVVTFMDGITMGGGVGISLPARFRVATENTRFAMPETGIGLFPDVGGGWHLSRLEGRVGQYLALTGARIDGAECLALGLATHYLPHESVHEAKVRIAEDPTRIEGILGQLAIHPPEAKIVDQDNLIHINRLFASDRFEDILKALEADPSNWAMRELATLRTKSPQTCKVALRQLAEGAKMTDFADEMRMEYRIGSRVVVRHDFLEGVRALIVDKDNAPKWNPAKPAGVTGALLDEIFALLPADEEWNPL